MERVGTIAEQKRCGSEESRARPARGRERLGRAGLGVLVVVVLLCAALVPAGAAQATPSEPIEATLTFGPSTTMGLRIENDTLFLTRTTTATMSGDLVGTFVFEIHIVQHLSTGTGTLYVIGMLYGTVRGQLGTAILAAQGTFEAGRQQGHWRMLNGFEGLRDMHMHGTLEGPIGGPIVLTGSMHVDPDRALEKEGNDHEAED
jgi:hypothetical protein